MLEDISSFTNIPTPLALGGLIVGAIIIIFLAVLRLKIFPRLNRELGERTISRMMLYLFILALVGIILGFVGFILPVIINQKPIDRDVIEEFKKERTLREAIITLAQRHDGKAARIDSSCPDSVMNLKVKTGIMKGKDHSTLIYRLQYLLVEPLSKEIYQVNLTEEGIYDITCKN